jgi:hypothetical protein
LLVLATKITGLCGLYEFHSFHDIINNLFGHQFTSQDFSTIDVNGDGQITTDEFSDELDQMPGTSLQAFSGTSIIAVMNALTCSCDTDNSGSTDINENGGGPCAAVQLWMLGQTIDGFYFTMADENDDGFIDFQEGVDAIQLLLSL